MGSIQRRGNNTYLLTVSQGFGLNGKRKRHTKTVTVPEDKAEKLLPKLLAQFEAEVSASDYTAPSKLTFEAFALEWLEKYAKCNLRPKTYQRYSELLYSRIIPAFKNFRLDQITPMHLLEFYENLREEGIRLDGKKGGLSDRTIKHHHRLMSAMLTHAVQWNLISDNPAKKTPPPKVKKTEADFYTDEETIKLIEALTLAPLKYKTMVLLLIYTGVRRGELMGLTWNNVDSKNHSVKIHDTIQYVRGTGTIVDETKNETSRRTLAVPEFFNELFESLQVQQKADKKQLDDLNDGTHKWINSNFVFCRDNGDKMHPDTITKWFNKFITKNNLKKITIHGLRHTNATLLISQNMDVLTISKRLGHATTSTTLNIYGHALKNLDRVASEKLEHMLKKPVDNSKVSTSCQQATKKTSD